MRGVGIYSLPLFSPAAVTSHIERAVTENPAADTIVIYGSDAVTKHLLPLRLFAPSKKVIAVLSPSDLSFLSDQRIAFTEKMRMREDMASAVSCSHLAMAADPHTARGLERILTVPIRPPGDLDALFEIKLPKRTSAGHLGVIHLPPARHSRSSGMLRLCGISPLESRAENLNETEEAIRSNPAIDNWMLFFSDCGIQPSFLSRFVSACGVFRGAGAVLPGVLETPGVRNGKDALMLAEAASLAKKGKLREPAFVPKLLCAHINARAFMKTGGFDSRFRTLTFAWNDIFLRMNQAGFRVIQPEDCAMAAPPGAGPDSRKKDALACDCELFLHKWCARSLKAMELMVSELPPEYGRRHDTQPAKS